VSKETKTHKAIHRTHREKTHKTILRTHIDKNTQNNHQNPYRQKHTKQSSEPIWTKTHKAILRTHREKNTPNYPQNP
jgi:hypothetical protein